MIKVGVIGCGYWGPNLIRNFSEIEEAALVWCCDLDISKLNRIKSRYPHVKITPDYNEILNDRNINAVAIATQPETHYRIVKDSLLRHKHVLVEKPITFDVDEARDLIAISEKVNKILMVGHTFEFNPAVIKIREYLDSGDFGNIYYIISRRVNLGIIRSDINSLWSIAPHDISILLFLLKTMPLNVRAWGASFLKKGIEDIVFVALKFPKNIIAHIQVSWLDPHKIREIVIVGSKKMVVYDDLNNEGKLKIYDKGADKVESDFSQSQAFGEFHIRLRTGDLIIPKIPNYEPLKRECEHFIECIRDNKKPLTDGENGLRVVQVLESAYKSLKNNGVSVKIGRKN